MSTTFKDQFVKAISSNSSSQPGAVLLNGGWGVGKTHFWNNEVVPELTREHIYISVGNVDTPQAFYNKITFAYAKLKLSRVQPSNPFKWIWELGKILIKLIWSTIVNLPHKLSLLGDVSLSYEGAIKLAVGAIDFSNAFPSGCIICIDDLERSQLKESDLLSVCLGLQEIKDSSVVLICNEDKLDNGLFKINKEKLVWKTFDYKPLIENVFDHFLITYSSKTSVLTIKPFRDEILQPFLSSGKNLRVLARCIKDLSEIVDAGKENVTAEHIRFFCSLYSWACVKGELLNIDAYRPETAYASGKNELKEEAGEDIELTSIERESIIFHKTFYTSTLHNGFSEALYLFIKGGILDSSLFLKEIIPIKKSVAGQALKEIHETRWFYFNDPEIETLITNILNILKNDRNSTFEVYLSLVCRAKELSLHINKELPAEIDEYMLQIINYRAPFRDETFAMSFSSEKPELVTLAKKWIAKYEEESNKCLGAKLQNEIIKITQAGESINTEIILRDYDMDVLVEVLTSPKVLDEIHAIRNSNPEAYYVYFLRSINRLKGSSHSGIFTAANIFNEMVERWEPIGVAANKRKQSLLKVIKPCLKPVE